MSLQQKQSLIFNHYGVRVQLEKLKEKMVELIEEIDSGTKLRDFERELADVINMTDQMKSWIGEDKINKIQHEKCDRQLKRMEK